MIKLCLQKVNNSMLIFALAQLSLGRPMLLQILMFQNKSKFKFLQTYVNPKKIFVKLWFSQQKKIETNFWTKLAKNLPQCSKSSAQPATSRRDNILFWPQIWDLVWLYVTCALEKIGKPENMYTYLLDFLHLWDFRQFCLRNRY